MAKRPVSNHTKNQPKAYKEPFAMNQNMFYMPKSIIRPAGVQAEKLSDKELVINVPSMLTLEEEVTEVKETKKTRSTKKEA